MFDLTDKKETALHMAAGNGHLPMVKHLVKTIGFDVKDKDKVCSLCGPFLGVLSMDLILLL